MPLWICLLTRIITKQDSGRIDNTFSFSDYSLREIMFMDLDYGKKKSNGGAIYFKTSNCILEISLSWFMNCSSCKGGGVFFFANGKGKLLINTCCSSNCKVVNGIGQFIYSYGECQISKTCIKESGIGLFPMCQGCIVVEEYNSYFNDINISSNSMFANSALSISSYFSADSLSNIHFCQFSKNLGIKILSFWFISNVTIDDCVFSNNTNLHYGMITNDFSSIHISRSIFINNELGYSYLLYNNYPSCTITVEFSWFSDLFNLINPTGMFKNHSFFHLKHIQNISPVYTCPLIEKIANPTSPIAMILILIVVNLILGCLAQRNKDKEENIYGNLD